MYLKTPVFGPVSQTGEPTPLVTSAVLELVPYLTDSALFGSLFAAGETIVTKKPISMRLAFLLDLIFT